MRIQPVILLVFALSALVACKRENKRSDHNQTILSGSTTIVSDETLVPIVEDQLAVFESEYKAKIALVSEPESQAVNMLLNDVHQIAVLSRDLTPDERRRLEGRQIIPKVTKFAIDAVAFVRNSSENDTLIAVRDVVAFMQGQQVDKIKGIILDNPNSSTARYLCQVAGIQELPGTGVYSFGTTAEALQYLADNKNMVGVIGLNWLLQPSEDVKRHLKSLSVLSVKGVDSDKYVYPTQNNLAEGIYPLARDLFVVNCQGFSGLGMGFASFVAGERGQRIVLKSGLLPVRIPGRKILIRNQINKE